MFLRQENFFFSRLPAGHKVEYIYLYLASSSFTIYAIYTHLTWGATRSSHTEKMALIILPSPSPKIIRRK